MKMKRGINLPMIIVGVLLTLGSYQLFQSFYWIYDIAIEKIAMDIDTKRNAAHWRIAQ